MIGRVTGAEVLPNKDGLTPVLMLQVEITDPDDVQSIELLRSAGVDSNPLNDCKVFIGQVGEAYKLVIANDDGILPTAEPGEYEIYSAVGAPPAAVKFARVKVLKDGSVEIAAQPGGIEQCSIILKPDGTIEASNLFGGNFKLDGITGQFSANGNFTVDI